MLLWLVGLLVLGVASAVLFPDTDIGRFCARLLIERPARWLNDASPRHLIVAGLVGVMFLLIMVCAPEFLAVAGDLALYVDLLMLAALTAVRLRWERGVETIGRFVRLLVTALNRARARAVRGPTARPRPPRDRDDPDPGWALA